MLDSRDTLSGVSLCSIMSSWKVGEDMDIVTKSVQDSMNGLALKIVLLGLYMFIASLLVAIIFRFIPIPSKLKQFIIAISSLIGAYIWYQTVLIS
ncbi:hypothetical protein [Aquibacillus saliphilus]|uniref:hypothetical protein n=1 Tax=Aquibacillus saliphilus TaxID=1909422 RepID=UPI001CF0B699|nr:hypothetical protein [Aquibacillus saliphilus]